MDLQKSQFKCRTVGSKQYLWARKLHNLFKKHGALDRFDSGNTKVLVKYFCPYSNWAWYVTEVSFTTSDDIIMFGLTCGHTNELGTISLKALHDVTKCCLGIERDVLFEPRELAEIRAEL